MCKSSQLVCSGYEKSIFFGSSDERSIGGPARFRRQLLTESERQSMSEAITSGVPPSQALGNIAEIDDECEASSPSVDIQITRGPFGAFRLANAAWKAAHLSDLPDPELDGCLPWDSPVEPPQDVPDSLGVADSSTADQDAADPFPLTIQATIPPSPLSIGAVLSNLGSPPPIDWSTLPWMPLTDLPPFGAATVMTDDRVQEVSDDTPWPELTLSAGPLQGVDTAAGLNISPPCTERLRAWPDLPAIPQSMHLEVPHDAIFLLKHYSSTVLQSLTPFRHSKTPWHVLFIPLVKTGLAALTLGEKLDHATLCTFYATLALSASSIAGMSTSDKWHEQSMSYGQQAHWHAACMLQSAYSVPKAAKYKSILMALLAMVQISTLVGDPGQAENYLLEMEKLIRIKGLNRRKSRKVRLLHHYYTFERYLHETSWPENARADHRKRIRLEIERSGAGAFSRDSLGFELTRWRDLDQEMLRAKEQAEGENDLHLQLPGAWPATLYPEIFGVPEIYVFLLSMIVRLARTKERAGGPDAGTSIGDFMMQAKSVERLIYQPHPHWLADAAADSECQRLLGSLVQAMREALKILFYRSVYDVNSRLLQGNVAKVCNCLRQIDKKELVFGAVRLLWPALIAAKEAHDPEARSFFAEWFTSCARRTGAGIFSDTLVRIQGVWEGTSHGH